MCGFCHGNRYTISYRRSRVTRMVNSYAVPCPMCNQAKPTDAKPQPTQKRATNGRNRRKKRA